MTHRKCTICGKDVVLLPPASERAKHDRSGRTAKDYLDLFPTHASCAVKKRSADAIATMHQTAARQAASKVTLTLEQRLRHARAH